MPFRYRGFSSAGGRLMDHLDLLLIDIAGPGVGLAQSSIYNLLGPIRCDVTDENTKLTTAIRPLNSPLMRLSMGRGF